jgi:hypothetical protein
MLQRLGLSGCVSEWQVPVDLSGASGPVAASAR